MDASSQNGSQYGNNRFSDFERPNNDRQFFNRANGPNGNRKRRGVSKAKKVQAELSVACKLLGFLKHCKCDYKYARRQFDFNYSETAKRIGQPEGDG